MEPCHGEGSWSTKTRAVLRENWERALTSGELGLNLGKETLAIQGLSRCSSRGQGGAGTRTRPPGAVLLHFRQVPMGRRCSKCVAHTARMPLEASPGGFALHHIIYKPKLLHPPLDPGGSKGARRAHRAALGFVLVGIHSSGIPFLAGGAAQSPKLPVSTELLAWGQGTAWLRMSQAVAAELGKLSCLFGTLPLEHTTRASLEKEGNGSIINKNIYLLLQLALAVAPRDSGACPASVYWAWPSPSQFSALRICTWVKVILPSIPPALCGTGELFPLPVPPPFPGAAAFHAALQDAGAHPGMSQRAGGRSSSSGRGPPHPLPSPGRCRRFPSLLRKRATPRAPGQGHEGLHMEVICSWERVCQRGCGTGPAVKITRATRAAPAAAGEPPEPRPAAFEVAPDTPLSRVYSADITSCIRNAPGVGSEGQSA